ncbi:putative NH(3)-dependent NAD(+) synthetase [uncultured archaeon]|nr:putative NH(3)-dependent NAD(+) synthetase [uncultured archaeon]
MKIALAQIEVVPGMPKKNLEKMMIPMIEEAKRQGADLISFTELCVGGYLLGDKWTNEESCQDLIAKNEILRKASNGIAIAYGNVYVDPTEEINKRTGLKSIHPNEDGRTRKYNAVYVFQNGKPAERLKETKFLPAGIQAKTNLPNYRIFDDERYFFSTVDIAQEFNCSLEELLQPFLIETTQKDGTKKKVPVGFELCEDLWCEDYRRNLNSLNPTKILINNGAEFIVNLSASPWTYGKNGARDRRVQFLKQECNNSFVPFFYVNCTGVQNNGKNIVTFDGGTTVYNKDGMPVDFAKEAYRPQLMFVDTENLGKPKIRKEKPKIVQKYHAIIRGLESLYGEKAVTGLSGGVDSSLVTALLVIARGKENVIAINMPTEYNSQKTKDSAEFTAQKLGIQYHVIPIQELVDVNAKLLEEGLGKKLSVLNKENLQAKIRSIPVLSNIAAMCNGIYTCNANKLEVILGYGTLDGDMRGAICPIADLTKTEIMEMSKYVNQEIFHDEVIPEILFPDRLWNFKKDQIMPTAELKEKQFDPMKFGYHCAITEAMTDYKKASAADLMEMYLKGTLDKHLDKYFDGLVKNPKGLSYELMKRWGVDNPKEFVKDIEEFSMKFQNSVWKRVQSAPIIITSKTAFGYDLRESILPYEPTEKQLELKQEILQKMTKYNPGE